MGMNFHMGYYQLARLLQVAMEERNVQLKGKKANIKSIIAYKYFVEYYFQQCIKDAIGGEIVDLNEAGHIQVIEVLSKKNYKWDKQYNGKDWKLLLHTPGETKVKFDPKHYTEIIKRVDKGMKYKDTVENHVKRLDELLLLLHEHKSAKKFRASRLAGVSKET